MNMPVILPYYVRSFPCINNITGKSTFGFLPYALIVMNPAPTDPGTNAPATNDNACAPAPVSHIDGDIKIDAAIPKMDVIL